MPNTKEVDQIKAQFSKLYSIDTVGLQKAAADMAGMIAAGGVASPLTIYTAPVAGTPVGALVPDLEQRTFASIPDDRTLRLRSIEQNLDEATRYLQACTAIRREYSDLAKLFVDTRLKSEEFFRLDDIHQQEVSAGLYNLPLGEATDELQAAQQGLTDAQGQKQIVTDLYAAPGPAAPRYVSKLSDGSITNLGNQAGDIAGWSAVNNASSGAIHNAVIEQTNYRSALEDASWQYTAKLASTNIAEKTARVSTASRKQDYLSKDVVFRTNRAAISRQLAFVQLDENTRTKSILNYSERLAATRKLFDLSFVKLCQRVKTVNAGATSIYGLDDTLAPPALGSSLDYLSGWLLETQDGISRVKRQQRVSIFTIWLSRWLLRRNMNSLDALKKKSGLRLDLNIEPDDVSGQRGLLRGVAFEYLGSSKRPLELVVTPPSGAVASPFPNSTNLPLYFGRTLSLAPGLDIRPQFSDLLWNGNPFGSWRISTDEDLNSFGISDIAMHVWLAY